MDGIIRRSAVSGRSCCSFLESALWALLFLRSRAIHLVRAISSECNPVDALRRQGAHFYGQQPVHQLMYAGTFAELAVVTEDCAVRIPESIPFHVAC